MIRIVTDSTCDLPPSIVDRLQITVLPLFINIGKETYLDGVDMSRQTFYQKLPTFKPHPTTAAPGHEIFRKAYEDLAAGGATEVLSIHVSKSLSATLDVAHVAAEETTLVPVTVVDSRQLSLGTGFLVAAAARAAQQDLSMAAILDLLEQQITRSHVFAALDTLEFLHRSGRMNFALASFGKLLQLKPLLRMYDGNPTAERVRTSQRALNRIVEILRELGPLEQVAIVHTNAVERANTLRRMALDLLPDGEILDVDITPVIGAHIGPGAVGFACVTKVNT